MRRGFVILALPLALSACQDWFTDFKQQPSVGTWQKAHPDSAGELIPSRGNPQGSVPVTGTTVAAWQVSYTGGPQQLDSMSGIGNPTAPDERSLANGRKYYQINCAVCHGVAGDAQTPLRQVAIAMGASAPSLVSGPALTRTDGYLWGIIRNGRGLMQPYNRIPEMDRWDVVNYVRGLQGRYPVEKSAVGFPGQTGEALPGASLIGPTRWVPHVLPSRVGLAEKPARAAGATREGGH
jgi:mono/diheme cytochrome c family protein